MSSTIWQTEDDSTASSDLFETNQSIITPLVQKSVEKAQASPHGLPKTGVFDNLLLGMTGIFSLVLAIKVSKKGKKELASVILLTATGASFLAPTSHAISSQILAKFNHAIEIAEGQSLPVPNEIDGYVYVGYLKESKEEVDQTAEVPVITEKPDTAPTHSLPEAKISEKFVTENEDIPFEKVTIYSSALMAGEQKVTQAGQVGKQVIESKQTYVNGQLVKTEKLSTKVISEPVEEITMIGTKDSDMNLSNSIDLPTLPIETINITKTKDIPFETHEIENAALVEGETRVAQEGANGIKTITIQQTIVDGQVLKEEEISSEITKAAIPRVIEIGTKKSDETVVTEVPDSAPTHQVPSIDITEEIASHVESIPFETQEVYDANLSEGVRQTVQIGQAGQRVIESKLTYAGGILLKSEIVSESVQAAIPQIVHIGTKPVSSMPEPEPIPEPVPQPENTDESESSTEIVTEVPNTAPTVELPTVQLTEEVVTNSEAIPFATQEVADPNLAVGTRQVRQIGQAGSRTIQTKLIYADGVLIQSELLSDIVNEPVAEIVAVGSKSPDQITNEVEQTVVSVPYETKYIEDPSLPLGQEQVQSQGVEGQKTVTTTYTLINGVRQANPTVSEEITKQPISQIVARGTKVIEEKTDTETRTEEIPYDIVVRETDSLYLGEEQVRVEGTVGSKEITTTYKTIDGVRQPNPTVTEKVLTEPVSKQVLKGTKPVEGTEVDKRREEIAFETKEIPSADLYVGEERVQVEGKVGSKEITTTYQTIKGVRQPNPTVTEKILTEPVAKQVLKGTKPVEGTEVDKRTEEIAFETKEIPSADLYVGEERVQVEGKLGSKEITTTYQTIKGVRQPNPTVTEKVLTEPVSKQVLKGTKPVEGTEVDKRREEIAFETKEIPSADLYVGEERVQVEGKVGSKEITTTYQTIKGIRQPNPAVTEKVLTEPVSKQVLKGTKPVEGTEVDKRTEEIAFETKEIPSADLYVGEERVQVEGKVGSKEITTTYQTIKGVRQPNPTVTEKVLTEPVAKQVLKGTKPVEGTDVVVRRVVVPYETKRIDTNELYSGEVKIVEQGKFGSKEIITTYQTIKGVRQPNPTVTEKILVEPIAREILRGTKPVTAIEKDVKTEVLPFETKYIDDPTMLEGKTVVEKEGKDGLKTITTIYQTIRGVRQNPPLSIEELIDHPEDKVVRRGTKVEKIPTVTIIGLDKNEDNRSATASYKLDNPTDNYLRAIALLYKGDQLVEEKEITDANGNMEFTNLDFYTDYTLKTKVFYTLDSVEHNAIQDSLREFDLVYKKIEVKDIDAVTVYRRKNGEYSSAYILDEEPTNPDDLFVKVTSDRFKDIYLPISSVKETTKNGQQVYELTSTFDQLVEDNGTGFNQQKVFYIPKVTKENGVYTDFTSLLSAMKANPTGTF
ncbi:hypothetical protein HO543_02725 [Streptococcus suis]|nr:hypothetical protein [Streptococcus suis]NQJ76281.1 hypothetical protein [Streptococcus suis]